MSDTFSTRPSKTRNESLLIIGWIYEEYSVTMIRLHEECQIFLPMVILKMTSPSLRPDSMTPGSISWILIANIIWNHSLDLQKGPIWLDKPYEGQNTPYNI